MLMLIKKMIMMINGDYDYDNVKDDADNGNDE